MARSFNGSTDRIDFANPFDFQGQPLTISAWVNPQTYGNTGYITTIHPSGDATWGHGLRFNTSNVYGFFRGSNGGNDKYRAGTATWLINTWYSFIVTDPGTTFGDYTEINMYRNGANDNGSGQNGTVAEKATGGSLSNGGRIYADDRNISAYLAEIAWWNRVLSADEIAALAAGYSPLFFRRGMKSYTSMVRTALDRITGSAGTLDGTSIVDHPPIIYPAPPAFYSTPAAPPAATLEQEGFRFRNDDGSESAATWRQAQDTNDKQSSDQISRLRTLVNANNDPASSQFQLEYQRILPIVKHPEPADWTLESTPVIVPGTAGAWDDSLWIARSGPLIKIGNTYFYYYTGAKYDPTPDDGTFRAIGVATSTDGINFTKYGGNPIVTYSTTGFTEQEEGASSPTIHIGKNGILHMYYGASRYIGPGQVDVDIRYRRSTDGYNWTDDKLIWSVGGQEYRPAGMLYYNNVWSLYFTGPLSGGSGALRRMWGASPSYMPQSELVSATTFRFGGSISFLQGKDLYMFASVASVNLQNYRTYTIDRTNPGVLGSLVVSADGDNDHYATYITLDSSSNTWRMFQLDTGNVATANDGCIVQSIAPLEFTDQETDYDQISVKRVAHTTREIETLENQAVVDKPTGTTQGDLLLAIVNNGNSGQPVLTPPEGWQLLGSELIDDENIMKVGVYYKIAGPSEPSTYTFGLSLYKYWSIIMVAYRGVENPFYNDSEIGSGASGTDMTVPTLNVVVPDSLLIYLGAWKSAATVTPPGGMQTIAEVNASDYGVYLAEELTTTDVGPTGTRTATLTVSSPWVATVLALTKDDGSWIVIR